MITEIVKRDGQHTEFELDKITKSIFHAAQVFREHDYNMARTLAKTVEQRLKNALNDTVPTTDQIQDEVERVLVQTGHTHTAK